MYFRIDITSSRATFGLSFENFLAEIDSYRYNKYFLLPSILDFLGISEEDLNNDPQISSLDLCEKMFEFTVLGFDNKEIMSIAGLPELIFRLMGVDATHFIHAHVNYLSETLWNSDIIKKIDSKKSNKDFDYYGITGEVKLSAGIRAGLVPNLVKSYDKEFKRLFYKAKNLYFSLKEKESSSILDGLL